MTWRSKRLGLFSGRGSASRRAIYKGCGYDDEDLSRPLIGVVNTANDAGLGHVHLDRLAERVKAGILQAGGTPSGPEAENPAAPCSCPARCLHPLLKSIDRAVPLHRAMLARGFDG